MYYGWVMFYDPVVLCNFRLLHAGLDYSARLYAEVGQILCILGCVFRGSQIL